MFMTAGPKTSSTKDQEPAIMFLCGSLIDLKHPSLSEDCITGIVNHLSMSITTDIVFTDIVFTLVCTYM